MPPEQPSAQCSNTASPHAGSELALLEGALGVGGGFVKKLRLRDSNGLIKTSTGAGLGGGALPESAANRRAARDAAESVPREVAVDFAMTLGGGAPWERDVE